jgi:predicted ATPase
MRYVYMNNFRGFTDTLVPLTQTNFLIGENSTGKSSFLSLVSLINRPEFWFNPVFSMHEDLGPASFGDIVSAWSKDAKSFEVGVVRTTKQKSGRLKLSFSIHEFAEFEDRPQLVKHSKLDDGHFTTLVFEKTKTKYSVVKRPDEFQTEELARASFLNEIGLNRKNVVGLRSFPKEVPPNSPLPIAVSVLRALESGEVPSKNTFNIEIPMAMSVSWIAPIRTKPKRIYDGASVGYSPEGEHAPFLLRKTLKSKTSSHRFAERLSEFGNASGLFETVWAHAFGSGAKNPFELLVKFKGAELNINNVGYGVSQALPLVVDFLAAEKSRVFAVQQPEVHLHPRAQAALGGLIFELAKEQKHSFFVETHSDYLVDRYRLAMSSAASPPGTQVLFFKRTEKGNQTFSLPLNNLGHYPSDQPEEFRDFFVKEEMKMLGL